MRAMLASIIAVALCGILSAGETPVVFQLAIAEGIVYADTSCKISYLTLIGSGNTTRALKISQKDEGGQEKELAITPESAGELADEVEPYVMLAKRGRKVDETIEHSSGLSLQITGGEKPSVRLSGKKGNSDTITAIDMTGDSALAFLDTLPIFPRVAGAWAADVFGKMPSAPKVSANAGDEQFAVTDLTVRPVPFGEMYSVQGKLTNNSGKGYSFALLKISFFSDDDALLGAADLMIQNLQEGETITIDGITGDDIGEWKRYTVRLESGL